MQYLLTPYTKAVEPWAWWEGLFTEQELDWLQQKAKSAEQNARIGGASGTGDVNAQVRRSQVDWLSNTPETKWVFDKLAKVTSELNIEHFRFDLTGFGESLQLTNYDQSENGMYGWHQDYGRGVSRKLSLAGNTREPSVSCSWGSRASIKRTSNYKDFTATYTDVYPEGYCQHLISEFERLVQGGAGMNRQRGEGADRHRKDDMQLGLNIKAHQSLAFDGKDTVDLFFDGLQKCYEEYTGVYSVLRDGKIITIA